MWWSRESLVVTMIMLSQLIMVSWDGMVIVVIELLCDCYIMIFNTICLMFCIGIYVIVCCVGSVDGFVNQI